MYYVREYTSTCRFLKIIKSILTSLVDYFKEFYSWSVFSTT